MARSFAGTAALLGGALVAAAACSEAYSDGGSGSSGSEVDAGRGGGLPGWPDAGRDTGEGDADEESGEPIDERGQYLLITEVMAQSTESVSGTDANYVEIWNPTAIEFDLGDYYLATSQSYATLPEPGDPELEFNQDFIARFPAGARIEPREVIVVAIDGEGFEDAYGQAPDFALRDPGEARSMLEVEYKVEEQLGISSNGEAVVLFHWDGTSNLVDDVDMMVSGIREDPDHANNILDKTGLEVDGPATGVAVYEEDAATMAVPEAQFEAEADQGHSYTRLYVPGEHILREGGNGITGHDVTSEVLRESWESFESGSAYTPPNPGEIPESLLDSAERRGR